MIFTSFYHIPVLLSQVIAALRVGKGKKYIDATLGGGGYTFEILRRGGRVLGIDQDQEAINYVREKLEDGNWKLEEKKNLYLVHGNFANLEKIAHSNGFNKVAGIIFDLGLSSYQLEASGRGFSYERDEPLDMRLDVRQGETAADLLNASPKERLYEIFSKFGEELHSRAIVDAIVRARSLKRISRTLELVQLIEKVLAGIYSPRANLRVYQQTKARIFQAIRIAVNNELENLIKGLNQGIELLDKFGRIAVVSFHSLEDRIVKLKFKKAESEKKLRVLTRVPMKASAKEILENSRCRSAKLRLAEKIS